MTFSLTDRQIAQRVDNGEWLGMQCVAMLGEEVVLDIAAGQSSFGVPMTSDTPLRWTCSSKVVTAILLARLEEEGALDVELPVREYLPDFPEAITCAHLLNHSAGLSEEAEEPFLARDVAVDRATTKPGQPDFAVGRDRMYSSFANFAVLAAVAEAATGKDFLELVDSRVLNGASFLGESAPTWIGDGGQFAPAVGELIPHRSLGTVLPGTGCVGTASQLAELVRVMSPHFSDRPRSAEKYVTRRAPFVPCRRSGDTAEWGLGFVVGRARFGRRASADTYGHAGCRSSVVLHDPAHDLTIAIVSNTISKSMVRSERVKPFIPAIYADLGY